jgi:hypothetical protein
MTPNKATLNTRELKPRIGWMQNLGVSAYWTTRLMGMPFDTSRYAGRAADDHSERFFDDSWNSATQDSIE